MSQLRRAFQGFQQQYPGANVSDFYGGLVINSIQGNLNNLGNNVNNINTTLENEENDITAIQSALSTLQTNVNSFELSKIVGIKNVYTKNLLLNELKTYKNIKITPILQGLNINFGQRQPNTSYQCRIDIVINADDDFVVNNNTLYRMWYPFLQKEYKLSSPTTPNWSQAKIDNVITLNNQRLLYFGDLKGQWTTNTNYKVGDLVYVQSGYPSFMSMPQDQMQTFVFICTQEHNSSTFLPAYSYQEFFRTDDDYTDSDGNHVFPKVDGIADFPWEILRLNNGSCRQWWFWNSVNNSVTATLYTTDMLELYYPTHDNSSDVSFLFQGTQIDTTGNSSYANSAHTLRQNNGIIVSIEGVLTLWTSNWWKTQTFTSSNSQIIFPTNNNVVEDGTDQTGKFLWVKFQDVALSYTDDQNYLSYPVITFPINIDIQPHATINVSKYSNVLSNKQLKPINFGADIINTSNSLGEGEESPTSLEQMSYIFDHNQGCWWNENT